MSGSGNALPASRMPAQRSIRNGSTSGRYGVGLALVLASTAWILGAACVDSSPSESGLAPSGSQLGDEFVVPDGASLVGSRFPGPQHGYWSALLLVNGDPLGVMQDLVSQAVTSGLSLSGASRGMVCSVGPPDTLLVCTLFAAGDDPPRTYSFGLRWGTEDGTGYSHVLVRRDPMTYALGPEFDVSSNSPWSPGIELPPPPEALDTWDPPGVGDPVAPTPSWFGEPVVEVEAGSTVIALPGPSWCVTGGYTAVLQLDDDADPGDVVDRYVDQFEALGFDGQTARGYVDGHRYLAARHHAAGGGDLDAVAVEGENEGPALLLLERCND
jgi:hypothetical protein